MWLLDGAYKSFKPPNPNGDITAQLKEVLMNNRLIQDILEDLQNFAECADDDIDMLDPATWENTPYSFPWAQALTWNAIALRAAHQQ